MSDRKKEQAVERALTEGYEKYYRLAYSYVHNEADALDIVQEAAYKAILKSDSLKEPQLFLFSHIYSPSVRSVRTGHVISFHISFPVSVLCPAYI